MGVIQPNTTYFVILVHDATNADPAQNTWKAWVNGNLVWTLTNLYPQYSHWGDVGFGWMRDWMILQDGTVIGGDGYNFKWWIWEVISFNTALTDLQINALFDYFTKRWTTDSIAPDIQSIFPLSWQILPIGNLTIDIAYIDTWSWIDTGSANLILEKWDSTNGIWVDISSTGISLLYATETGASYQMNNLDFWKYRFNFTISDLKWNTSTTWAIFYIDSPSFTISSWYIDIWWLNTGDVSFSADITITVKTIWAPFEVNIFKQSDLTFDTYQILDWNWTTWWGYDGQPYDGIVEPISINGSLLFTWGGAPNPDGNLNIYIYTIRLAWKVDENQLAWIYTGSIWFNIKLSY